MKFGHCTKIFIIALVLILSHFFTNPILAEDLPDLINADFTIEMDDATNLNVTVDLSVERFTLTGTGKTYTGSEIQTSLAGTEMMGAVKLAIRLDLLSQLQNIFEKSIIEYSEELPTYSSSVFQDTYKISLNSEYFGLNNSINIYELLNGVLDMGAFVNYSFSFYAKTGWNNSYTINLGDEFIYKVIKGGNLQNDNKEIVWEIKNWDGENPSNIGSLTIASANPSTIPEKEDIKIDFIIDTNNEKSILNEKINFKIVDISSYGILPHFITNLRYVSSDGIRLFIENNMLNWNESFYKKTVEPIKNLSVNIIENSIYNRSVNFNFAWNTSSSIKCFDCYDINNMDSNPPIIAKYYDNEAVIEILDISNRALFGLINSGGIANVSNNDINFGPNLKNIGHPYNITIILPNYILIEEQSPYTWNDTIPFEGYISSNKPPDYKKQEIDTTIEINFKNSDLNLLGFFTGNPELNFAMNIKQNKNLNVTTLPHQFSIPKKIDIKYLNSDAIRLCIQENTFTENKIKDFLEYNRNLFDKHISNIISNLDINSNIKRDVFDSSINYEVNVSNMSGSKPIKTLFDANIIYPMKFNFSVIPPSVFIPEQIFNLKGLKNQTVRYKIYFPKGLDIYITDELNKAEIKETEDQRKYIDIIFSDEEYNLSTQIYCTLKPTALYLISLFMPCIISFIIVMILVIVIILIRKKRKTKRGAPKYEQTAEEDYGSYEENDYYVPPPPGSK